MSTRGGTRATLYRVIAEKDAEIARLTKERDEARAVYSVCPVCDTSWTNGELADELSRLKQPPKRSINRDIEEALNSGDGTYKP